MRRIPLCDMIVITYSIIACVCIASMCLGWYKWYLGVPVTCTLLGSVIFMLEMQNRFCKIEKPVFVAFGVVAFNGTSIIPVDSSAPSHKRPIIIITESSRGGYKTIATNGRVLWRLRRPFCMDALGKVIGPSVSSPLSDWLAWRDSNDSEDMRFGIIDKSCIIPRNARRAFAIAMKMDE